MRQFAFCICCALLLMGCGDPSSQGSMHHSQHLHGDEGHGQRANEAMHRQSFEDLVKIFDDPQREAWQMTDSLIRHLDKFANGVSGKKIAEIGAGTGYISFRLAEKAAEVIAIDIDTSFLDYIEKQKPQWPNEVSQKITTRLCEEDDPKLASGETDMVIIVNSYHHIDNRVEYFAKLKDKTKELVIVDFMKKELPVGPPEDHKLSAEKVFRELYLASYSEARIDDRVLPYQYVIVAKP